MGKLLKFKPKGEWKPKERRPSKPKTVATDNIAEIVATLNKLFTPAEIEQIRKDLENEG